MRALLLVGGLSFGAVFTTACSAPPAAGCSAANCAGCCDSSGTCLNGDTNVACGAAASMCTMCQAGFSCQSRVCVRMTTGGGAGGGATGGGSATGGGGGATGGGGSATGGGGSATGGGGGATGGGGGATGGGGGATGGGDGGVFSGCQVMTPPTIPISFPQSCPSPTACGGNPAGTFFYTEACIPQSEFQSVITRLENAGCGQGNVRINGYDGGLAGFATFTAGNNLCRRVRGAVTVSATITGACANPTFCGLVSSNLAQGGFTGSCDGDGGQCDCLVHRPINIDNSGVAYTVGPTSLTITSNAQTFETCLSGATFSTVEVDAGTATHEPGTATMTLQ